jgi:hypothetical protein
MYKNYLDLNKEKIRRDVAFRLQILGYEVDQNTGIKTIQAIIKKIQLKNGLISDGRIGENTMQLLGYSNEYIRKMIKIPNGNEKKITFDGFIHLFLS